MMSPDEKWTAEKMKPCTDLEKRVLVDLYHGRNPWRFHPGTGSRTVSGAINRLKRKGYMLNERFVTALSDYGRDIVVAWEKAERASTHPPQGEKK
jgi:hypothetical protein